MIEKLDFYHGAALMRVIEDSRCTNIRKDGCGYRVNETSFIAVKYSTKARSPWGFTFSVDDLSRLQAAQQAFGNCTVAFVCGGDGVCALTWLVVIGLLDNAPGGISAKRGFAGCYGLAGPAGALKGKIAMNRWPGIIFEGDQT